MLTKMNIDGDNAKYLDVSELADGVHFDRLAYVTDSRAGTTKMGSGYFTFYVKDRNANVVRAQLFDVKDYVEKGFIAKTLVNKPVSMRFLAQIYNGQWSLIIENIQIWDGDFDFASFRGSVVCDGTKLKAIAAKIMGASYQIPHEYSIISLANICDGRCGGYLKLMDATMHTLTNYKDLPCIDMTGLLETFFYAMEAFYNYNLKLNKFPIIPSNEIFDILNMIEMKVRDNPYHLEIADACRSILGVSKPQHIYAHLICNAVKECMDMFSLVYTNAGLAKGSLTQVGGAELLRY